MTASALTSTPYVVKIYGPPGTGKTRALKNLVEWMTGINPEVKEELMEKGFPEEFLESVFGKYDVSEIAFVTFQNSALKEFVEERINMSLEEDRRAGKPLRYFRTVHGLCQTLLTDFEVSDWKVISRRMGGLGPERWFQIFAAQQRKKDPSFRFDPDAMGAANPFEKANYLWQVKSRVINREYHKLEGEKIHLRILDELPPSLHDHYFDWLMFKKEKRIKDFDDMLMDAYDALKAGEIYLPTKVLIVDEFQDLSPLQFEIFKMLARDKELVVIAGDDWQTIFTWMGASPEFLINYPADLELMLKRTFRLPERVLKKALSYAKEKLRNGVYKEMVSTGKRGAVGVLYRVSTKKEADLDLLAGVIIGELKRGHSVFVLTRTNAQALHFFGELYKRGFKPKTLKRSSRWKKRVSKVGDFFDVIHSIIEVESGSPTREDFKRVAWVTGLISEEEFDEDLPLVEYIRPNWKGNIQLDKVQEIWGRLAKRFLEKIINDGIKPMEGIPEDYELYVDTIHASKGREADVVFLINEMPTRNWRKYLRTPEEVEAEARVWFVGMTRARKGLLIINTDKPFTL
ncbi:hypothetical protein APY94_00125 [Thermococcus celericrescens]|uniref:DNA 3'-5' helicase n=1 Tax=Thermococcus celericrescens TaxID=227598 RepID=A0A100XZW2_9EURY|nr:ATP-dependent helicase [Thermococcus celericrescens]KUH34817.1 hypothetical protein APY94_00125 [Thermococcus celericrescens]